MGVPVQAPPEPQTDPESLHPAQSKECGPGRAVRPRHRTVTPTIPGRGAISSSPLNVPLGMNACVMVNAGVPRPWASVCLQTPTKAGIGCASAEPANAPDATPAATATAPTPAESASARARHGHDPYPLQHAHGRLASTSGSGRAAVRAHPLAPRISGAVAGRAAPVAGVRIRGGDCGGDCARCTEERPLQPISTMQEVAAVVGGSIVAIIHLDALRRVGLQRDSTSGEVFAQHIQDRAFAGIRDGNAPSSGRFDAYRTCASDSGSTERRSNGKSSLEDARGWNLAAGPSPA